MQSLNADAEALQGSPFLGEIIRSDTQILNATALKVGTSHG